MDVNERVLALALAELSSGAKRRILKTFSDRTKGMRSSETPGHLFWYAEHRKDEHEALALLFPGREITAPEWCEENGTSMSAMADAQEEHEALDGGA